MLTQFMDLGMAVVAACNAVVSPCGFNLCVLDLTVFKSLIFKSGLKKTAATAAAIIIGSVRLHIHKIFFSDNGFDNKPQIFGYGITIAFSDDLAGILYCEFYFQVFIPV